MKKVLCLFLSAIMLFTSVFGTTIIANANTMNTAEKITNGKTYSYNYTYEYNDEGEEIGEYDHYYSFIAEKGVQNCEVFLTINSEITNDILDNIYLELIDETDSEVASGTYIPSKKAFYMPYEYLEEGKTYFIAVTCFGKANLSVKLLFHKHSFNKKELYWTASTSEDGLYAMTCSCGEEKEYTIPKIKTVSLSSTNYTYNGKVKTPSVTVKDRKGKTLKKNTDYSVTYANGRKNVGKYKVTVKFKGNYSGTVKKAFTVKPKSTSLSKLVAGKKKFTAKWKKQATQTTGYQIQYATNKNFKNAKTITVNKNKTTSKTISKLKSKKKYYARIRTYKSVNGTKFYSSWSKSKSITTKGSSSKKPKKGTTVYITPTGKKYHYSKVCAGKKAKKISLSNAKKSYKPCKKCAQ